MICYTCKKMDATNHIWSAGWMNAYLDPMPICESCLKGYVDKKHIVIGDEAFQRHKAIKEYIMVVDRRYDIMRKILCEEGNILHGSPVFIGFFSKILIEYQGDFWIVSKYLLTNLGGDNFWNNRIQWC